jgi:hypothetical protein
MDCSTQIMGCNTESRLPGFFAIGINVIADLSGQMQGNTLVQLP